MCIRLFRRDRSDHCAQDLVLRSEAHLLTAGEYKNLVDRSESTGTMSNHNNDGSASPCTIDRIGESTLALFIEVGIGFVQHNEERIVIQSARECYPLSLAG